MDREKLVRIIRDCTPRVSPAASLPPPLPPEWEALVFPPEEPPAALSSGRPAPAAGGCPAVPPAAAGDGSAVSPAPVSGGSADAAASSAAPSPPESRPVRAVLFDIYGTLFCSAAGDIGAALDAASAGGPGGEGRDRLDASAALAALVREWAPGFSAGDLTEYFKRRVLEIHAERAGEVGYPEVRVEAIWAGFLERLSPAGEGDAAGAAAGAGAGAVAPGERAREFALRYELAVNPAVPLPGAAETIASLRESGVLLGLISNAQFFTPLLFDAFFGASPEGLGFDPALTVYSFDMGEAKPSPALFGRAAAELARRGVDPGDCVYVGNDMRNDILAAAAAGWRTVLFAGDPLSLRTRRGDPSVGDLRPWRVIRDLRSLTALLHIPAAAVSGPPADGRQACLPSALYR